MEGSIQKRIEWIEKRTPLSDRSKHYIAFQMQLYAEDYHEKQINSVDLADVSKWRFLANEKPDKEGIYQVFDFKGNIDSVVYGNSGFVGEPDGFFNGKKVKASEIIAFR